MKKLFFIPLMTLFLFSSCSDDNFVGSGQLVSEIRTVDLFTKIKSEGVFEINIVQGSEQFLEITANENIIHRVLTKVVDNELRLYLEDGNYSGLDLSANITVTALDKLSNSGTGDIIASSISNASSLEIKNSGTGNIEMQGTANTLELKNEGSGEFNGFDFSTSNCIVNTIGTGDCEVFCDDDLNVKIVGTGDVYYKGQPIIEADITGSGKLIHMD